MSLEAEVPSRRSKEGPRGSGDRGDARGAGVPPLLDEPYEPELGDHEQGFDEELGQKTFHRFSVRSCSRSA
jgi:hypothetical protein